MWRALIIGGGLVVAVSLTLLTAAVARSVGQQRTIGRADADAVLLNHETGVFHATDDHALDEQADDLEVLHVSDALRQDAEPCRVCLGPVRTVEVGDRV